MTTPTDDLIKRLTKVCKVANACPECLLDREQAAATLREQQAELERLRERVAALEAENARLTKAVNEAREVAMIRHCDVNANGKTILDFHEVWLRQAYQRAERAEASEAEARTKIAEQMIEIAQITDERKDWARRFLLDEITPWEWMTRAKHAESRIDAMMANVEQAEAERDALQVRNVEHEQFRHQHRDCDALAVERDALRADAERYRWLREHPEWAHRGHFMRNEIDFSIDAAIANHARRDRGGEGATPVCYRRGNYVLD